MKYQTQKSNTYSKLTIEALEQGVKYVQSKKKNSRAMTSFCSGWMVIRNTPSKHFPDQNQQ